MAKAKINENGELVNAETGEPIGRKSGNTTSISSDDSGVMFTLEDYGVSEPDFPEEENNDEKDDDEDFSSARNIPLNKSASVSVSSSNNPLSFKESGNSSGKNYFSRKKTKYEVTENSYFIVRFGIVMRKDDGRFIPLKEEAVNDIPEAESHWVKFRMWNYSEELQWKSECLEYNSISKIQFLNVDKLNERKIKCLMLDWSFGEYDDSLKLLHCDGKLSDESYNMFMGMYPSIASTIVDMMNLVLESNQ